MKHPRRLRLRTIAFFPVLLAAIQAAPQSHAQLPPAEADKQVFVLSQRLHPIDNERWKEIAGARITEKYQIARGDTLSDISKRLFGDSRYWPKIWALNNATITNPHLIKQGNSIAFQPGSGTELPQVAIQTAVDEVTHSSAEATPELPLETPAKADEEPPAEEQRHASKEWKKLPPHQRWEEVHEPPATKIVYKDLEVNQSSKKQVSQIKFELPAYAATQPFESLGTVVGANTPSDLLTQGNLIYVRADEKVRLGETYDITAAPVIFKERGTNRVTYSYPLQGRVKLLKKSNGLYLGRIISALDLPTRSSFLIPAHPRINILTPIPGPSALKARVLLDHRSSTYAVAQFKEVFIDRGSDDGIAPGMVFRAYQRRDSVSGADFDDANLVVDGEVMVVQVSERVSAAIVTQSNFPIMENAEVRLVTEAGAVQNIPPLKEKAPEDDLEKLGGPDQLEEQEKRELKQLERWKGNPSPTPTPTPTATPTPSPEAVSPVAPAPAPAPTRVASPTPELPPPPPPQENAPPSPAPETAPSIEMTPGPLPTESGPTTQETPAPPPAEGATPPPPPEGTSQTP